MRLKRSVARLVMWERVCRVATVGKRGVPHLAPVCQVVADGKIYFASGNDGRKVLNIRENPKVAVTVDLYSDDWANLKGAMIQGTAQLLERGPRFRRIRRLLYDKYPQYPDEAALDESDSVIIEVVPDHVLTWGLD
jgi:nitroimidazol reductase NimA-like FMN-containing flavoprotein (pyridoxamine 5'-phosphate oxidase superfamily)